ncbi:MAG: transcription termination/antitermination factor NusG [Candidatus Latescibacteria bacterium]|nr:transcription termination/antitermination factor NusG [Candidatus Latescibacterota bacterium]
MNETQQQEAPPSNKKWFVIHTYSGHENKVRANLEKAIQYAKLEDRFGDILVATENFAVLKNGKKTITKRKTFPGYVIVEMELDEETKHLVTSIPGVTHFVGDEKNPMPLTEAEINRIRGHEPPERERVTAEVPFKVGESVKVIDGPFCDFVGTVDEINSDRGKVRVMVSIFGRPTPVELDFMQVEAV